MLMTTFPVQSSLNELLLGWEKVWVEGGDGCTSTLEGEEVIGEGEGDGNGGGQLATGA